MKCTASITNKRGLNQVTITRFGVKSKECGSQFWVVERYRPEGIDVVRVVTMTMRGSRHQKWVEGMLGSSSLGVVGRGS